MKSPESSKKKKAIYVYIFLFITLILIFERNTLYDYLFSPIITSEETVSCIDNTCIVTFKVVNRTGNRLDQEFYVGVWPNLDPESPRNKGELVYAHVKAVLLPREKKDMKVEVVLAKPMIPEGAHPLIQKAWW